MVTICIGNTELGGAGVCLPYIYDLLESSLVTGVLSSAVTEAVSSMCRLGQLTIDLFEIWLVEPKEQL